MSQYFLLIVATSLWCCGLSVITQEGKILYFLRYAVEYLPKWLFYPLLGCLPCMASIHTAIVYAFLIFVFGFHFHILIYVFAAVSAAFTNLLLWRIYDILDCVCLFLDKMYEEDEE